MELLNPPISKTPQLFSSFSSFTPRLSIKTSKKKTLHRFQVSKFQKISSFPRCLPSSGANVFHVSAQFGRPTSRRNSLRKKLLLDHQKVRQNHIPLNPTPDCQNPNGSFENTGGLNSGGTEQSDVDNDVDELKSKRLGESVLLTKLGSWIDQYKKDAEFWGVGSGPIFTVLQDSEGNVKGVTVNEDEILKRLEFEDLEKVNSRVLYAKNLAREMELGANVIPKNSSVAKFVVSGKESGLVSGIRGVILSPGFMPKLSRVGSLMLCGFLVLWAVKKLFVLGNKGVEYTGLEKEMMRRKMKSRKEREMLEKGSVEVVQASVEPPSVSFEKPKLDRQELMNNISKAKAAKDRLALLESSGSRSSKSVDLECEIQEIEVMAKKAREIEGREQPVVGKDEMQVQAPNKEFSDEMQAIKEDEQDGVSFPSNISTEDVEQGKVSYRTVESTSPSEPRSNDAIVLNGVASLDSRVVSVTNSSSVHSLKVKQSTKEDINNMDRTLPSVIKGDDIQSPVIPDNKPYVAEGSSFGKKPRVILSVKEAREFLSGKSNKEELNPEPIMKAVQESAPDLVLSSDKISGRSTESIPDVNNKIVPDAISSGESTSSEHSSQIAILEDKESVLAEEYDEHSDEECREEVHHQSTGMSTEQGQSEKMDNWIENNFHEVEPVLKKIGDGFRENYMVAREKVGEQPSMHKDISQLGYNEDESEFEWMKDDKLRDIVFQVRENELAGRDPFYMMDAEAKLAFFQGLEKKVVKENEKLSHLHEWLHSNIENLDYGADGISVYDPPEKIIPRWKGPPLEKSPEFLNYFQEQRKVLFNRKAGITATNDGQNFLQNPAKSPIDENLTMSSSESDLNRKFRDSDPKDSKIVVEGSDGSVKPGKKSGKEYWQHTKKWSRGFLESYNAENDPEVKSIMKDIGKDLDRWMTEKEVQEAADVMTKLSERNKKFMEKKLNKLKREMELFGPQAVVSKYREYAEENEEDYLWWLDLPHVLAHMDMLGNGRAFIVPQPPKNAFREAKANGLGVTVIRKGELQLNVDQTLEEVEEQICEIGSKMYHDKIMNERSVDISSLMKGVLSSSSSGKTTKRSTMGVSLQLLLKSRPTYHIVALTYLVGSCDSCWHLLSPESHTRLDFHLLARWQRG
ncbi:hypothetical protein COLO4_06282 [Corchorus olitorius]|uniref:Uncharacterized protein n=1 Tax=Corchorus olitorius TaxID=93759 RepID=A0A1R3KNM8_9ROSI|nr:hypothetical protein COLO4_06282 [Corchorus olitorius]